MTVFSWPTKAVDELRKLVANGCSASVIAASLSETFGVAVSRSGVIGKMHRAGICTKKAKPRPRSRSKPPSGLRFVGGGLAPRQAPPPQAEPEPIAADLGPTMRLIDRAFFQCAFPYGEPSANMMCCGRPIKEGSYCAAHRLVTHVHSPSRHRQPERRAA